MTKKEMQKIIDHTTLELIGEQRTIHEYLGKYVPGGANWAYWAGWTIEGELVVTRFGIVMGGQI